MQKPLTSGDGSRSRLLGAGAAMLAQGDRRVLERGFTAKDVAEAAGLSRRTFYDQFETVGLYVDALLDFAQSQRFAAVADIDLRDELERAGGDVEHAITSSVSSAVSALSASDIWRASVVLSPFGSGGEPAALLLIDELVELIAEIGLTPRIPLAMSQLRATLQAVVEGAASSEAAQIDASAVALLAAMFTTDVLDDRDRDEVLDELFEAINQRWYELQHPVSIANLRTFIVDAAADVFRQRGYVDASVEDVGRKVGLGPATIERYIGTKETLADELVSKVLPGLGAAIDQDLQNDPFGAFTLHLARVASLFADDRALVEVVVVGLLRAEDEEPGETPAGVVGLLELGARAHAARKEITPANLAMSRLATAAVAGAIALEGSDGAEAVIDVLAGA